jgi:trehalose-6-phosphate synthase
MNPADQERRMDTLRRQVRHHDLATWAAAYTQRLRQRSDPYPRDNRAGK